MIGKTIGDYRILEKRGEGGMGMFFKAQDIRLDRLVGLKTIRAELLHDPELLGKLEEEAKSLARLDHPNIARLLHYMVIEDQRYIVMEYVEGSDLAERLRRDGPLSMELMAHLVPQICAAIGYAHNRHVIHRDIKPSNILVTADNTVKVTDFGIAKILGVSAKTKTGVATGSLPYMAPEQIRGTGIDARTDIYQLGVMFFELLVGRRPFLAETEYDMMSHHLSTPPPVPSSLDPKVPKAIDRVLLKALAKNPQERFATTSELSSAFKDALALTDDSRTVYGSAPRPGADTEHRTSPPRSRKRLVGGAVIAILVVLAFATVFLFSGRDEAPPPSAPASSLGIIIEEPLPSGIEPEAIADYELVIQHPLLGTLQIDSVRLEGSRFHGAFSIEAADSIRVTLTGYDVNRKPVVSDDRWIPAKGQSSMRADLELRSLVPPIVAGSSDGTVNSPPAVATRPDTQHETSAPRETPATANLVLDVQPFAERERIEAVWLDGKRQPGQFPLELNASRGLRIVRWQIGPDYWTDTVAIGDSPVQKNLMFEMSRGRVNVAVTFSDGPGYAEILLDGQETGQGTPGELRNVASGPHEITLKRDGYRMQGGPFIVRVPANDRARINIPMGPR